MARVVAAVVAAVLLIAVLLWRLPGREPEVSFPAEQPEATAAAPAAAPAGSRQAPVLPGTIFDNCDSNSGEELDAERVAAIAAQQDELLRVLSASADAEHLLVAALSSLHSDQERAMTLLSEAAARDPRHPLIAAQILTLCTEIDACSGARPEMERNLIAADKGNAIAWVEVARSRLQRNDERGALAALREAAAAAAVEDYFTDYIYLFDRGLAAASDLEPFDRMVAAIGHSAGNITTAYLVKRDCEQRAANLPEWRDACLRLGERFENDSFTILTQTVGIGLQIAMYELEGDGRAAERAVQRREEFAGRWKQLASRTVRAEELRDATVLRQYLETFASAGEVQAMEYLGDEVEARLPPATATQQPSCEAP